MRLYNAEVACQRQLCDGGSTGIVSVADGCDVLVAVAEIEEEIRAAGCWQCGGPVRVWVWPFDGDRLADVA